MITLSVVCLVAVVLVSVALAILSVPLALIFSLLPWLLRVASVVLLVKALVEKPVRRESFLPAIGTFAASIILGWIL